MELTQAEALEYYESGEWRPMDPKGADNGN